MKFLCDWVFKPMPFCNFEPYQCQKSKLWDCLPSRCRINLSIVIAVCALLSVAIIIANSIVLAVYIINSKIRNSQSVFKISLAISDMMVGAVVLPFYVWNLSVEFVKDTNESYLNAVGFFTAMPIIASLLTLIAASIDRFRAIHKPFTYIPDRAKRLSIRITVAAWLASVLFAVVPIFTSSYILGHAGLVNIAGVKGTIVYGIFLLLPLLILWSLTIATYWAYKRHMNITNMIPIQNRLNRDARVATTLAIMSLIFTFDLVPLLVTIGISYSCVGQPQLTLYESILRVSAQSCATILLFSNSLWNVFIYSVRNEDFRKCVYEMLKRIKKIFKVCK